MEIPGNVSIERMESASILSIQPLAVAIHVCPFMAWVIRAVRIAVRAAARIVEDQS
jgi:hypothetical protein